MVVFAMKYWNKGEGLLVDITYFLDLLYVARMLLHRYKVDYQAAESHAKLYKDNVENVV